MLSKKYYKAIASAIQQSAHVGNGLLDKEDLINELSIFFKWDNPQFDKDRFLTACGIEE